MPLLRWRIGGVAAMPFAVARASGYPTPMGLPVVSEHRVAAARSLGIGLAVVPLVVPLLGRGGLAPLVVTAAVALLVGAPAAVAEWRTAPDTPGREPVSALGREAAGATGAALAAVAEITGLLLVAAALAGTARTGELGALFAAGIWIAGMLFASRPAAAAIAAVVGVGALAAIAARDAAIAPPWTLLEPRWEALPGAAGPAVVAGVLLAGAGTGQWTLGPRRPPGDRFAPWAAAGLALGAATLLAVGVGARFEATRGALGNSVPTLLAVGIAHTASTAAILGRRGPRWAPGARAAVGFAATLLLAGPGSATGWDVAPWVTAALVPAGAAVALAAAALRAAGTDRATLVVAVVALVAAAAMAWPGLPDRTLDATVVGMVWVAAFWFVATRSVLARRAA